MSTEEARRNRVQLRNWCFTLNNPSPEEIVYWTDVLKNGHERIMYLRIQSERGLGVAHGMGRPGTFHYQGYMELKTAMRQSTMKNVFGRRVHWEGRAGTQKQADDYCNPESEDYDQTNVDGLAGVYGKLKRGGSDRFELAVNYLSKGGSIEEVQTQFPVQYAMFQDKLEDFAITLKGRRRWAMDIEIFVGPTGTGKSRKADAENVGAYYVPWPTGGRWWWPRYHGQDTVIMDEFRHQIKMDVMLKMLDRYDWWLESKGRSFQFVSKKIIITTNIDPKHWYPGVKDRLNTLKPLQRRIREFAKIYDFAYTGGMYDCDLRVYDDGEEFEFEDVDELTDAQPREMTYHGF